jgi:uncharacterized protein (TIGR03437 family)
LLVGGAQRRAAAQAVFDCVLSPAMTEGPYWVDEQLNRPDIRVDPSNGSVRSGVLLNLAVNVYAVTSTSCAPLAGAHVDIWHCDASGLYSDVSANNTVGQKFLRGYQITDDDGVANFTTIYPGWYSGRTVHIHLRIRTYSGSQALDQFTSQLFFDDSITDQVFTQSPYNTRGSRSTRNTGDNIYNGQTRTLLTLTQTAAGYSAAINVGVNLETPPSAAPSLTTGGIGNAASYAAGVAPGGWISIFGQNLAASTRTAGSSDLINGYLPTTLGGVSVKINNKSAFMHYVSPTQINVQAPADDSVGAVQVTVTNASGTSNAETPNMQSVLPGLFEIEDYVAAVRLDGTIITAVTSNTSGTTPAAKPGDIVSLFGTGFGPTNPAVEPGLVFEGAYPLSNEVTVRIGGLAAAHSFAGLVAAGLYQFNITVPALGDGDHDVIVEIAGLQTPAGVPLKVQS